MRIKRLCSLALAVALTVTALPTNGVLGEKKVYADSAVEQIADSNTFIKTSGGTNDFPIVSGSTVATLWVDSSETAPVKRVVNDFKADIKAVTSKTATISNSSTLPSGPVVIIGTIDKSAQIKALINNGKITSAEANAIRGKWEAYLIKVIDKNTLVVAGSDKRGAIYGTYEISEQMGVSPWYYFGDVPIATKSNVFVSSGTSVTDKPDVQFRGIFINDEEKLGNWEKNVFNPANGGSGTMGPVLYGKIFELILRLKGNYIWPAMHVNSFDKIADNITTIDNYGVVMRKTISAGDEWSAFKKKYASANGLDASTLVYDYTVNPDVVKAFWRDSISYHKNSEVQWMFGMRGEGDVAFNTANINDSKYDKYGSDATSRKAGLLSEIIADQYQVLKEEIGTSAAVSACKSILPYKEVLDLYNNANFTLPSDMTVIWCDENHGMLRRTPTERDRQLGNGGIYMHASYWAPANQSYMWMSSIPLSVIGEELNKCWETGIRQIWVLNVGDIKPIEGEMDYFIRCGWDVDKYTDDSLGFSREWAKRHFPTISDATANEIADILNTFYHHSNIRKTEHMRLDLFDMKEYNEWDERMQVFENLYQRANAVANSMTSAQKAGFYELVQCKINWIYLTNKAYYYADMSTLAYDQGRMASAQKYSDLSIAVELQRKAEIQYYSTMLSGKWAGLIDPENYAPPVTSQLPETNPTLVLKKAEMGVFAQTESEPTTSVSTIKFSRYNQTAKYIDIFNKGAGEFDWSASADRGFITLSKTEGTVTDEERIFVSVNDFAAAEGKTATITIKAGTVVKKIKIEVEKPASGIQNRFVEADGYVSIEAEHYSSISQAGNKKFRVVNNAGRGFDGDMMQAFDSDLDLGTIITSGFTTSNTACMTYDFYLTSQGSFPMEIYRLPTMNAVVGGKLRFAYSIDNQTPVIVSSTATDEGTTSNQNKQWVKNIFGMIEKHVVNLPNLSAGNHTLKIWMVDNYITLDKYVIYTNGSVVPSAMGPRESYHSSFNSQTVPAAAQMSRDSAKLDFKNVKNSWGSGQFVESAGKVGIEAEYAMENVLDYLSEVTSSMSAYTVSKKYIANEVSGKEPNEWRLTQSDTGYAMRMPDKGSGWSTAAQFPAYSPELSYRIKFSTTGTYNVWLRWRYVDNASDSIRGGLDNTYVDGQFTGGGGFHSDKKDEKWHWQKVASIPVSSTGTHTFSLWIREDGLMVDKIYLTTGSETAEDSNFVLSSRADSSYKQTLVSTIEPARALINECSYPLGTGKGCYDSLSYYNFVKAVEDAEKLADSGTVTSSNYQSAINNINSAKAALDASLVLSDNVQTFNAYRDFEDDELGLLPYGFDKMALTNGAKAVVKQEGDNKYLSLTTASTAGKANLILPFNGSVTNTSGNKVVVEYKARFTGNYTYANAAMLKNDADLYSMVAAFDNNGGARAIKVQNAGTKTTVMNFESGRWYSFKMVGDFTTHKYSVYVDNNLVASDFTFRDSTGTRLTGQLIGIDGFANGQLDFDDFSVRVVSDSMLSNASSNVIAKVNDVRGKLNSYSYPIGDKVGCYKPSAYTNLNTVLNNAYSAAQSAMSDDDANALIKSIEDAWTAFDGSLKLKSGNANYYACRDFENDTAGLLPYGFTVYKIDNGGAATIVSENGNKFLRLTTGDQAGHVNMSIPYVDGENLRNEDELIVSFSARFNEELRYANAFIAKNQNDGAATSMAFDNASGARKVILKKSASSSITAAYFNYGTWHDYKAVVNLKNKTYSLYMDGSLVVSDYEFRDKNTLFLYGHSFGIDGFTNGQLDLDNFKAYTVSEGVEVSDGVVVNGYQISATAKGMRTVYSVADSIDGKTVVSSGLLYSLSDYADFNELTVGSENTYVYSYASTTAGKLENAVGLDNSYAMTMTFASNNPTEYTTGWVIRAWAQLSDGTYAYSDAYEYTIYNVAERLYTGYLMPSQLKHDYLYNSILTLVNPAYVELPFKWGNSVANW